MEKDINCLGLLSTIRISEWKMILIIYVYYSQL